MIARKRWICWPNPDRICLQGGCLYCYPDNPDNPLPENQKKTLSELLEYAKDTRYWPIDIDMETRRVR